LHAAFSVRRSDQGFSICDLQRYTPVFHVGELLQSGGYRRIRQSLGLVQGAWCGLNLSSLANQAAQEKPIQLKTKTAIQFTNCYPARGYILGFSRLSSTLVLVDLI
jgi:hypothetical protein